jgi:hypothetical protein
LKNGDEIMLLRAGESVLQKDEIGFIYIMKNDLSKPKPQDKVEEIKEEEEVNKKRKIEEISKSKEELEKKA